METIKRIMGDFKQLPPYEQLKTILCTMMALFVAFGVGLIILLSIYNKTNQF